MFVDLWGITEVIYFMSNIVFCEFNCLFPLFLFFVLFMRVFYDIETIEFNQWSNEGNAPVRGGVIRAVFLLVPSNTET